VAGEEHAGGRCGCEGGLFLSGGHGKSPRLDFNLLVRCCRSPNHIIITTNVILLLVIVLIEKEFFGVKLVFPRDQCAPLHKCL
jgi:hypothetical protein